MTTEAQDPECENLFLNIFGDIDTFNEVIYKEILLTVDSVERKLKSNTRKSRQQLEEG